MSYVDLHMHSTASDGTTPPQDLPRLAREAGLSAIALTDHDTIGGCAAAQTAARELGIDFLCGIEISCEFPRPGTLHLLGYGVDPTSTVLHDLTRRLIEGRETRNEKMVALLREAGIDVTLGEVLAEADGGTVGRPHLARILVKKGYVTTTQQAFDLYLGQGGKFYVDKETTSSRQAIEMIHSAGGIAVLAHPVQLKRELPPQLETVIKSLADQGLDGIEAIHSDHNDSYVEYLFGLAKRWGMIATGGSDFHANNKAHIRMGLAGNRRIPRELYEGVLKRLGR